MYFLEKELLKTNNISDDLLGAINNTLPQKIYIQRIYNRKL